MRKIDYITLITKKASLLNTEYLVKLSKYIDFLEYDKKVESGTDKDTLTRMLNAKGFKDVKFLVKQLHDAHLPESSWGYHARTLVNEWIRVKIDCNYEQAEEIIKLMSALGYLGISSFNNVVVRTTSILD